MKYLALPAIILTAFCLLTSCKQTENKSNKIIIVCTTSIIGDGLKNICDSNFIVKSLMGPDIDPHTYKASPNDINNLKSADIIFYNGLHLEGKMSEILHNLEKSRAVYAISDTLQKHELLKIDSVADAFDPHLWFSIKRWSKCLEYAKNKINKKYPKFSKSLNQQWNNYLIQLKETSASVTKTINKIPVEKKILVTAHDAFNYFANDFNFEVKGLQGISTLSEYGLKDISELIQFIIKNDIKSIHTESSISPKSIEAVIEGCNNKGHKLILGDVLYSDALGHEKTSANTYIKMYLYNVNAITKDI